MQQEKPNIGFCPPGMGQSHVGPDSALQSLCPSGSSTSLENKSICIITLKSFNTYGSCFQPFLNSESSQGVYEIRTCECNEK